MEGFVNSAGNEIVYNLIKAIQENKQYLSEIDGAIGDGDHGINMNKGFSLCEKELRQNPGNFSHSLKILSRVLMRDIGGSMGPLYGMLFKSMSKVCEERDIIDAATFGEMLKAAEEGVKYIGSAEVGDKTLLDTLVPAVGAYIGAVQNGKDFKEALDEMREAAVKGRDSTKEMVAKVGRASRLGERSRGVIDAGAASCCIIICTMADSIKKLL